jgi:hypothetical protein
LNLTVQAQKNGPVIITWLNSDLGDISFQTVNVDQSSRIDAQSIRLGLDAAGQAQLSWSGRVWRQVKVVLNANQPVRVTATVDGQSRIYDYDPQNDRELVLDLPVKNGAYYLLADLLVLPFTFLAVYYLMLLLSVIKLGPLNPARFLSGLASKISFELRPVWIGVFTGAIYGILALVIASTGFFNRIYLDDYCYLNIYHRYGLFGAIFNSYREINGRFASHVLNFLAFSFGKNSIPFGPLTVLLVVGCSLFYLFTRLLLGSSDEIKSRKKTVHFISLLFTLIVIVTTSLMAPFLYESIDWTLHALIITGSLFLINFLIGLALYFSTEPQKRLGKIGQALIFALVGFCAMGFSELASLFLLTAYGLIGLALLVLRKISKYWGMLAGFAIGAGCGLLLVALTPASVSRASQLGVSINPTEITSRFYALVQENFRAIFLDRSAIGLLAFFVALLLGYIFGRTSMISLRFEDRLPRTPLGQFILMLLPILLTVFTLLPFALLKGYMPARTLYIPIYLLVVQYFILSVYMGRKDAAQVDGTRFLFSIAVILVLILGATGLVSLGSIAREVKMFAAEFDARETAIYQAQLSGLNQIKLPPYQNMIRTDIPSDPSNWFVGCLTEYYGMKLSLDQ